MSKHNSISINWTNTVKQKTPKPIKKKIKKKSNNDDKIIYEPTIEELGYNMFIDTHESDIIDLLFDLEQICDRYALNILDNKNTGFYSDFVKLIADNVSIKLPILDDDYDSSNNDYIDINEDI